MINKSNIGEVSIEQKDFKVTIKQKEENITQVVAASMPAYSSLPQQAPQQSLPAAMPQIADQPKAAAAPSKKVARCLLPTLMI